MASIFKALSTWNRSGVRVYSQMSLASGRTVPMGVDAVNKVEVIKHRYIAEPRTAAVVGAPLTFGQPFRKESTAPDDLRNAGLHSALFNLGWRVSEAGNIKLRKAGSGSSDTSKARDSRRCGDGCKAVYETVLDHCEQGHFSLVLGGDHSLSIGSLAANLQARPDIGVIWIDSHADINTPETSPTGHIHGMVLAFLTGLVKPESVVGFEWLKDCPRLEPKQVVYIGLRDVDYGERQFIKDLGILSFTMKHVDQYGIGSVMAMALEHLKDRPLYASFDVDVCDDLMSATTELYVRGGLTFREASVVLEAIAETGCLVSADLVDFDSYGDHANEKLDLAINFIASLLGNRML